MKDRIVFDTTEMTESDNVGAWLRSSDGTLITHSTINSKEMLDVVAALRDGAGTALTSTLNGSKQSLDVNVTSEIAVAINGVYNGTTNLTPDSAGAIFHNRSATPGISDQVFRATGGTANADDVTAANVQGLDTNSFMMGYDGAAWDRITATSGALDVHLKTQAGAITVSDAALANTAIQNSAVAIDNTAGGTSLGTPLSSRKYVYVQNLGNQSVFLGTGTVTAANGFRLSPSSVLDLRAGAAVTLKAIGTSATAQDIRLLELS